MVTRPAPGNPAQTYQCLDDLVDAAEAAGQGIQSLQDTVSSQAITLGTQGQGLNVLTVRVNGKADQIALQAEAVGRAAAVQALSNSVFSAIGGTRDQLAASISEQAATLTTYRQVFAAQQSRPGDCPLAFGLLTAPKLIGGPALNMPVIPSGMIVGGDNGTVVRVRGAGVISQRQGQAVEYGRIYRVRAEFQRRADPSDPANDAVVCGIAWLDQNKYLLKAETFALVTTLKAANGRVGRSALYGRGAGVGPALPAPAGARYARAFVQTFGLDGVTDVEVLGTDDLTNNVIQAPAFEDQTARLDALESLDIGDRLDAVQAALGSPNTLVLPGASALRNTVVPASMRAVSLLGFALAGDGGGARYVRAQISATSPETITSQDGSIWELAERVVRPEMLGAFCDDVQDDAPFVRRVVAHLTAIGGGVLLYSADKIYRQHGAIIISGSDIVVTREPKASIHYPKPDFGYEHCFLVSHADKVIIDGLHIYSDTGLARAETGFGVCIDNSYDSTVKNCLIERIANASIWVQNSVRTTVAYNTSLGSLADGIHFSNGADRFMCVGNRVETAHDDAIAMVMDITDQPRVTNGFVANNTVLNITAGSGITICGVDFTIITGNMIDGTDNPGFSSYNFSGLNAEKVRALPSSHVEVFGNSFVSCGRRPDAAVLTTHGMLLNDCYNFKIRSNTISSPGGATGFTSSAMILNFFRDLDISDNTITDSSGHGIYVFDDTGSGTDNLSGLRIKGNSFYNVAMDPIRLAPNVEVLGPAIIAHNTFMGSAYTSGAKLIRLGRFGGSRVVMANNVADGGAYFIDRGTCTNAVLNDNVPALPETFDPNPQPISGGYGGPVTRTGTFIDQGSLFHVEITAQFTNHGGAEGLLLTLPFPTAPGSVPNLVANDGSPGGSALRAVLRSSGVVLVTNADGSNAIQDNRFITVAGTVRKAA